MESLIALYILVAVFTLFYLKINNDYGNIENNDFQIIVKSMFWFVFLIIKTPYVIWNSIKMENKFINSKFFDIIVYTIGGIILCGSELKRLAISSFHNYSKQDAKKIQL